MNKLKINFKNRRELAFHLNTIKAENVAEIGVREGHYSRYILANTNIKKLYAIDPWEINRELANPQECYDTCKNFLNPFGDRFEMIKEYSVAASKLFCDEYFDFIYIDAMHTYENVKEDILSWYPKLKKGGILAGHDYHQNDWPGVVQAVDEFVKINEKELNLTDIDSPDYIIEHDGWKPSWWFIK